MPDLRPGASESWCESPALPVAGSVGGAVRSTCRAHAVQTAMEHLDAHRVHMLAARRSLSFRIVQESNIDPRVRARHADGSRRARPAVRTMASTAAWGQGAMRRRRKNMNEPASEDQSHARASLAMVESMSETALRCTSKGGRE